MEEKAKIVVIKAYDSDEHNTHAESAHFDLAPSFISTLRDYLATAQLVKERHPDSAFRVEFWDWSLTYFSLDCDAEDDLDQNIHKMLEKVTETEKPVFLEKMPGSLERYLKASEASDHPLIAHTECDVLKVDCDGDFHWGAILKHTSIRLDTATLNLKDLEEGLKGWYFNGRRLERSEEMNPYSVLQLYPDYACRTRIETFFNHTTADDPYEAAENVEKMASEANAQNIDPNDLLPLAVMAGHVELELGIGYFS